MYSTQVTDFIISETEFSEMLLLLETGGHEEGIFRPLQLYWSRGPSKGKEHSRHLNIKYSRQPVINKESYYMIKNNLRWNKYLSCS